MLYYLCLSEEDYDDVDSNTRHSEVDNEDDNNNDTPFDPYAFALKVLENEAAEIKPKEAWHDGVADNEVNDDDVEKKNVKSSALENGSDDSLEVASEIIRKT